MITSPLALRHVTKLVYAGRLHAGVSFVLQHEMMSTNQLSLSYATKRFLFSFPTDTVRKFSNVLMGLKK